MKKIIFLIVIAVCTVVSNAATKISVVPVPFGELIRDIGAFNNNAISVVSGNCILRTTDKGESWSSVNYMFIDSTIRFEGIATKGRTGFAIANVWVSQSFIWKRCVLKTTNAGQSWFELQNAPLINQLRLVEYDGETLLIGCPFSREYSISYDKGNTWQPIMHFPITLNDDTKILIDGQKLFFTFYNVLYQSENGSSWSDTVLSSSVGQNIKALAKTNNRLLGVGYLDSAGNLPLVNKNIFINTHQVLIQSPWTGRMYDVKFVTQRIGFMCGWVGNPGLSRALLYKTTNGGNSWSLILDTNITVNQHHNAFKQIEVSGNAISIGGGNIIVTISDIVTEIEEGNGQGVPQKYELQQNYPNPFNPVTKISFSLPKDSFVDLKIYDSIGREVQTLIQEIKNAGEQSVTFNGAHLSSGIYFYKLQAGDFVETKKMILQK